MPCVYKGVISDGHFASICDQACNNQLCEHKNCWFLSTLLYHNLLTVNSNATKSLLEFNGLYAAIYRNNILATFRTEILTKI